MTPATLETERLILRPWKKEDLEPFAALNADPEVCEFLPGPLTEEQSNHMAQRIQQQFQKHGYGWFAVEQKSSGDFVGFAGLNSITFSAHFTPAVEIGWRLARSVWGCGYAAEAARAAVEYGFLELGLEEIVSFTVPENQRSRRVMEKLGMEHSPQDSFEHPSLPEGDPLRLHVFYRLRKEQWDRSSRL